MSLRLPHPELQLRRTELLAEREPYGVPPNPAPLGCPEVRVFSIPCSPLLARQRPPAPIRRDRVSLLPFLEKVSALPRKRWPLTAAMNLRRSGKTRSHAGSAHVRRLPVASRRATTLRTATRGCFGT